LSDFILASPQDPNREPGQADGRPQATINDRKGGPGKLRLFWRLSDDYIVIQRLKDDVKDAKDSKLSDPFYDSLEGLLSDLKAVTVVCGAALCFPTR
jgi:hypothetical protein